MSRRDQSSNGSGNLERVNLMIGRDESAWLDQLVGEIARRGGKVSRSEIVRAALAMLRELHDLGDAVPFGISLGAAKRGSDLIVMGTIAVRALRSNYTSTPTLPLPATIHTEFGEAESNPPGSSAI